MPRTEGGRVPREKELLPILAPLAAAYADGVNVRQTERAARRMLVRLMGAETADLCIRVTREWHDEQREGRQVLGTKEGAAHPPIDPFRTVAVG